MSLIPGTSAVNRAHKLAPWPLPWARLRLLVRAATELAIMLLSSSPLVDMVTPQELAIAKQISCYCTVGEQWRLVSGVVTVIGINDTRRKPLYW